MKRLALALLCIFLVGCGGSDEKPVPLPNVPPVAETTPPPDMQDCLVDPKCVAELGPDMSGLPVPPTAGASNDEWTNYNRAVIIWCKTKDWCGQ